MGFLRQEYWSRLPFPSPGIEPTFLKSPALADEFLTTSTTWEIPSILRVLVRSKALILTVFAHFSSNVLNLLL